MSPRSDRILNKNDLLQIREIVQTQNIALFDKMQFWSKENMTSKLDLSEVMKGQNKEIVDSLKKWAKESMMTKNDCTTFQGKINIKVFSLWGAIGMFVLILGAIATISKLTEEEPYLKGMSTSDSLLVHSTLACTQPSVPVSRVVNPNALNK